MTAEKQLAALKWIAATFGSSIVGLVIWGATLTADVGQLRSEVDDMWLKYNIAIEEGKVWENKVSKIEQKLEDMEKSAQDDYLKKLFEHKTQ